jgi:hypothetical protein
MMKNTIILLSILFLLIENSFAQGKRLISLLPNHGIERGRELSEFEEEFLKDKNSMNQNNPIAFLAQIQEQGQARVAAYMAQSFTDGIWVNSIKLSYAYDANGNLTEEIVQIGENDAWVNYMIDTYEYNVNANLTEHILQIWQNDVWVNAQKEIYTYDTNGNQTEYITQDWKDDAWVDDEKKNYTYDENGNLTEEIGQDWENEVWINHWKYTYSYDANGNLTERLRQRWQDDIWVNYRKHTYAYDLNGNQTEYILQFWNIDAWMNMTRYIYVYDVSGNLAEYLEQNWKDEAWETNQKRNYTYDTNGNIKEKTIQNRIDDLLENSMKYSYEYDANGNQTENILEIWQNDVWVYCSKQSRTYDTSGNVYDFLEQIFNDDAWVNSGRGLYAYENCAPAIFSIPDMTIDRTQSFSYTVWALGSPPPFYTLVTSPVGMTINDSTGLITWTAELGTYPITVQVENVYGSSEVSFVLNVDSIETDIKDNNNNPEPTKFLLTQNYPNPFNSSTKISYSISKSYFITLKIYDLLGKEIQTLISEFQQPNTYSIYFDASKLSSGIYFYRLQVGSDFIETKRMLLMR